MSTKRSRILSSISGMLALGLVYVLLPSPVIAESTDKNQALIEAGKKGRVEEVTALLNRGANIDAQDQNGWTALMWSVSHGDLKVIQLLLDGGANINVRDQKGSTALAEAAERGYIKIVKLLLEKGADPHSKGTALLASTKRGDREIMNLLVDKGANFNTTGVDVGRALTDAVLHHESPIIKLLLDHGADINAKGQWGLTPLMWAVWGDDLEMVKLLLDRGADANGKTFNGRTALMEAAARDYQIKKAWNQELWDTLKSWYRWNRWGPHYPSGANDPQTVKLLLQKGADVNAQDKYGETALKRAQRRGHKEIVELLKAHGAKE